MKYMLAAAAVLVLALCVYNMMARGKVPSPASGKFTVYGTDWCGFTTKQRKYLDNKYGPNSHTYVNCDEDKGSCAGMDAFPVTKTANGEMVKGFSTEL